MLNNDRSNTRKHCGNCGKVFDEADKYCKYCGMPIHEDNYVPSFSHYEVVYGPPPVRRTHKCEKCGFIWDTFEMIDTQKYCPECGTNAPCVVEDDPWGLKNFL